ncbi:two-component system chemotaxis sensor kinase CheA [Sphingomonas sp. SORGH_AS 950]|uniref:chemotaxis protein CheA n=1 Tax=Sphingomonas sp. SORGH_AS_0950 TaxID=3041792 RepID=UPI002788BF78|nr:chemotaxis protein CheW [Sphingomonas sp. SORGH_AS_0950]MDQ1156848.1 two-component system chemotaxis sensor kinase CheA [Sphingomonas sp. SORGH_AS_0950]
MDDLLQEFIAETRETLEALSGEIVAWEAAPADRARLDAIFRFVHTVKGSCGFLDLPRLARLSHAAEDVLAAARDGSRTPDTALVDAVLGIVDRIGAVVEAIATGTGLDDSDDDALIAALTRTETASVAPVAKVAVPSRAAPRSIRLNVDLLDRMMSGMSDMVLARNELARRLRDSVLDPRVEAALDRLSLTVADMRDTVTRTRMQKVDGLFSALPRMVRDTAAELGKAVALRIEGSDVDLDREMIEMMRDPLVHIIRNAIDHGIETPAERRRLGKPATGQICVAARQSGNQILIEIEDDGAGIDVARIAAKAVASGVHSAGEVAAMTAADKQKLVFEPGLSSRDTVSTMSGRGVGMDVVRANIEHVGGRVALDNRPGRGLAITIQVPLTLSIMSTIVVAVGDQRFAIARQSIEEIVKIRGDQVRIDPVGAVEVATVRGRRLPMLPLGRFLGVGPAEPMTLVIISTRDGDYALGVDDVLDTEEVVVKPAAPAVMGSGLYAGQTLPDSGLPMLLLDGGGLAQAAGLRFHREVIAASEDDADEAAIPALLFDDLDGCRRAMPLGAIDRVEKAEAAAVHHSGGRVRLVVGETTMPLHHVDARALDRATVGGEIEVLRLTDGEAECAYAIAAALEIIQLPADIAPSPGDGTVLGVAVWQGEPIEILDPLALFGGTASGVGDHGPLLCLLDGAGAAWMDRFLRPVLEANGYRCAVQAADNEVPAVRLMMEDEPLPEDASGAPVVRLRRERDAASDADSVYRYDRPALIAALASHARRGGR